MIKTIWQIKREGRQLIVNDETSQDVKPQIKLMLK